MSINSLRLTSTFCALCSRHTVPLLSHVLNLGVSWSNNDQVARYRKELRRRPEGDADRATALHILSNKDVPRRRVKLWI